MTEDKRVFMTHEDIADAMLARDDLFKCSFHDGAGGLIFKVELRLSLNTSVSHPVMHAIQVDDFRPHVFKAAKGRLVHDFVNKLFKETEK